MTRAAPFATEGKNTEVFVRFSNVASNKGSFDLARDVRGLAVKFFTEDGNWDIVGNNIPVFFIQDPIKFPELALADNPAAVDFLSDAFVHCKLIGRARQASGLMKACGLTGKDDAALCKLDGTEAATDFVSACRSHRYWPREAAFTS